MVLTKTCINCEVGPIMVNDDQLFVESWITVPDVTKSKLTTYQYNDATVTIVKKHFTSVVVDTSNSNLLPIYKEIIKDIQHDHFLSLRISNNSFLGSTQFKLCKELIDNGYYLFLYYYVDPGQTLISITSIDQLVQYLLPHDCELGKWQLIVFPSNKKLMVDQYMRFKHRAFEEENHRV